MTEDEILAAYNPIFARFSTSDRAGSPPLLAHYTSIEVMEKILTSNEIWFSNPLFMNDLQELRFGVGEGTRLFFDAESQKDVGGSEARRKLLQHAFSHFHQELNNQDAFDTYLLITSMACCPCGAGTGCKETEWLSCLMPVQLPSCQRHLLWFGACGMQRIPTE